MHLVADLSPDAAQPRQSGVCGFGYGALNVKLEDRFRRRCPLLCQSKIGGFARAIWRAVLPVTDEIDIGVVVIGRPMPAKIFKELRP